MSPAKKKSDVQKLDFESSLTQIASLVDVLEQDNASLEESLSAFEGGVKLVRGAQAALKGAEQKVQTLLEENASLTTQDFSADEAQK